MVTLAVLLLIGQATLIGVTLLLVRRFGSYTAQAKMLEQALREVVRLHAARLTPPKDDPDDSTLDIPA